MMKTKHLVWMLPLATIVIVSLLYQAGASQLTRTIIKRELARQYGLSEATIERYASQLPEGWAPGNAIDRDLEPHDHSFHQVVTDVEAADTGVTLTFAHMGDGEFPGQEAPFQTTYMVVNNAKRQTSGTIDFFKDDGSPLNLEIDGVTASSFPFQLSSGNMQRLVTSGAGELKSGWARIRSKQPIVVTSSFGAVREDGTVITDVGVSESKLGTEFTIFADTIGSNNTGVALTNPSEDEAIDVEAILRDAGGATVDQEVVHLEPRAHTAVFLSQLFPTAPGIKEFEGTVLLRSVNPAPADSVPTAQEAPVFAGLTLRTSGTVFTSVPMVPPLTPDADFTRLAFPQAADGELSGLSISTTPVLLNTADKTATGVIEFFKGDGSPNQVRVNGTSTSSIPFSVAPGGVFRVDTDGTGPVAVGWARVATDQPLAGVVIFTIRNSAGRVVAAVGVNSAYLRQSFELVADTTRLFDTALAIVNPLEPGDGGQDTPVQVKLNLRNTQGWFEGPEKTIELSSRQHQALFLTQLFPEVENIDEFEGRLEIDVVGNDNYVVALSLRSAVEKLTSAPVFSEKHAFHPTLTAELATNLRGFAPGLRWELHQNSNDLEVNRVEAFLKGIRLRTDHLEFGSEIGSGFQTAPGRLAELVVSEISQNQIQFDMLLASDRYETRGQGTIETLGDGVRIQLTDLEATPVTFVFLRTDLVLLFDSGIFEVDSQAERVVVEAALTSVAQSSRGGTQVVRRTVQDLELADPGPLKANIEGLSAGLLTKGERLTIHGTNFGPEPKVLFPGKSGSPTEAIPFDTNESELVVFVPAGTGAGFIRVDNGNGPGNGYAIETLFSPTFSLEQPEGAEVLILELRQDGDVLEMEEIFEFQLFDTDLNLESLAVGQQMGIFKKGFSTEKKLFVQSIDDTIVTLEIGSGPGTDIDGTLIMEQLGAGILSLRTPLEKEPSEVPRISSGANSLLLKLDNSILTYSDPVEIILAQATALSAPSGPGGSNAALKIRLSDAFVR